MNSNRCHYVGEPSLLTSTKILPVAGILFGSAELGEIYFPPPYGEGPPIQAGTVWGLGESPQVVSLE